MLKLPTRRDMKDFIAGLRPYAFVTIVLNQSWRDPGGSRHRLRQVTKDIALRLDQGFLKTLYATCHPAKDRFDAVVFPEKLMGNPHAHMAFFGPENASENELMRRRRYLLRSLVTDPSSIAENDLAGSFWDRAHAERACRNNMLQKINRALSGHVCSVHSANGLAWYMTKEYNMYDSEFWFLHEFHSSRTPSDWRFPK